MRSKVDRVGVSDIMKVEEFARWLRISRSCAYCWIANGEVPGVRRIGRTIRLHRPTVLQWLSDGAKIERGAA